MSIATSALIRPSKFLLVCLAVMSLSAVYAVWRTALDLSEGLSWSWLVWLALAAPGCMIWLRHAVRPMYYRIDVSANGCLMLGDCRLGRNKAGGQGVVAFPNRRSVQLGPRSTLWPILLALQLTEDTGRTNWITILPDSTSKVASRQLLVACRWAALHNNGGKHRISTAQSSKY